MKSNKLPQVLTIQETAELLRVQRAKVYILIENETLKATKIGQAWRVWVSSVEALVGPISPGFGKPCRDSHSNDDKDSTR
jgi:excisionase family DNA binding protein